MTQITFTKLDENEDTLVVEGDITGSGGDIGDMTKAVYDPAGKNSQIATESDLNLKLDKQPNGTIDLINSSNSKIAFAYLPDSIVGGGINGGTFDINGVISASGNVDSSIDGKNLTEIDVSLLQVGTYFMAKIDTADGYIFNQETYYNGDWCVYNNGPTLLWARIGNTDAVQSVNSKVGQVVINKDDVGLGNADNTADLDKPVSTAVGNALNEKVGSEQEGGIGVLITNVIQLTEAEYTALTTKNSTTLYLITE